MDWILANKEWLFSGGGVATILVLGGFALRRMRRLRSSGSRTARVAAPILVPEWLAYVSDTIFGCYWHWTWRSGWDGVEVENLTALCPTNKCLNELAPVHDPGRSDPHQYRCDRCGFSLDASDVQSRSLYQLHERVKAEIRRRIRTGEYKPA